MRRYDFIENKAPRTLDAYIEHLVFDDVYRYMSAGGFFNPPDYALVRLTVYEKNGLVLAIAHETPENKGVNMGQGAISLWETVKNQFAKGKNISCVQGHNGYYEYVEIYTFDPGKIGRDLSVLQMRARWHRAGSIDDVMKVMQ